MLYYVAKFLSMVFCILPYGAAMALGRVLGEIFWLVLPKRRKILARKNIVRCLEVDEREANIVAKKSVVRFGVMAAEVLRFPVMKKNLREYLVLVNEEHLETAKNADRGIVGVTAHSGNWELLGGTLAGMGISFVAVGTKQRSSGADRFITEYRALLGMHNTYKTNVREMYDLLKKGWFIGLLTDQDPDRRDGIVFTSFNRPTNWVTGAAALARYNDAPILPVFLHRLDDGRHEVIFHPPIYVTKTKDKKADIRRTTQELAAIIEAHIRQYPEEWFWIHDRWKSMREEWQSDTD